MSRNNMIVNSDKVNVVNKAAHGASSINKTVVIVGAGVQGLIIAYKLAQQGFKSVVLEADKQVGGLLAQEYIAETTIDRFYHHYFLKDKYFLKIIKELGLQDSLFFKDFKASYGGTGSNLRELILLGLILLSPNYKIWESISTDKLFKIFGLKKRSGLGGLLFKKFGNDYKDITSAWLWARIHARYSLISALKAKITGVERLYFLNPSASVLISRLVKNIIDKGGIIKVNNLVQNLGEIIEKYEPSHIVLTTPLPVTQTILQNTLLDVKTFVEKFNHNVNIDFSDISKWLRKVCIPKYKAAINAIVVVKNEPFDNNNENKNIIRTKVGLDDTNGSADSLIKSETYWAHLPDKFAPFLVKVAQHIAYTDLKHKVYYLGAYVAQEEIRQAKKFLANNITDMLGISKQDILDTKISVALYASHVPTIEYIKHFPNIYVGNLGLISRLSGQQGSFVLNTKIWASSFAQLHPWDRGVNYAILQAKKVVKRILSRERLQKFTK